MPAPCSVVPLGTRSAARVAEAISGRWRREGHAQRQARTLAHQEQAIKSVLLGGKRRIQPPVAPLAPAPTLLCAASPGVFGPAAAFETPEHNFARRQEALPLREGLGTLAYDVMWYSEKVEEAGARRGAVQDGTVPDWNEALALAGGGWVLGTAQDGDGSGRHHLYERKKESPGARDPPGGTDDLQLGPMAVLELVLELVLVPVAGAASLEPRPAPSQDRAQRAKANTTTPCGKSRTECVYWQSRSYEVQTAARLAPEWYIMPTAWAGLVVSCRACAGVRPPWQERGWRLRLRLLPGLSRFPENRLRQGAMGRARRLERVQAEGRPDDWGAVCECSPAVTQTSAPLHCTSLRCESTAARTVAFHFMFHGMNEPRRSAQALPRGPRCPCPARSQRNANGQRQCKFAIQCNATLRSRLANGEPDQGANVCPTAAAVARRPGGAMMPPPPTPALASPPSPSGSVTGRPRCSIPSRGTIAATGVARSRVCIARKPTPSRRLLLLSAVLHRRPGHRLLPHRQSSAAATAATPDPACILACPPCPPTARPPVRPTWARGGSLRGWTVRRVEPKDHGPMTSGGGWGGGPPGANVAPRTSYSVQVRKCCGSRPACVASRS
ncbi:hypothetical protein PCL_02840 [Purpureocillium lilacinum]|uniref:Uncharacterized protein n=1 Tax=Purpureocillium lilacinum TaxID=33203 RepID=A0A2U3DZ34_PURLI|nr:hypothetical protein PCL_02840 [Purpureocillium lilacinum]